MGRGARALLVITIAALLGLGAAAQGQPTVEVAHHPELGDYLVAANGLTLYQFTRDREGESTCFDECAEVWQPYTAQEPLVLPEGLEGELTLIERDALDQEGRQGEGEGTRGGQGEDQQPLASGEETQVAYNGIPLYFYADDLEPGDVNGQGVDGVWFVVAPGQQFGEVPPMMARPSASGEATPAATPGA